MTKFSPRTILAATAVAGSILLSTANSSLACPFSKFNGKTFTADGTPSLNLSNQSNFNKLGIIGAGAVLGMLALGGLAVRASAAKAETEPQEDFPEVSSFSIPIPPEVLAEIEETADEEKLTSVG